MNCQIKHYNHNHKGRASAFISRGSLTIEAALAAPFFLLAMLCILSIFEVVYTETIMRTAFLSAAKQMAKEAYVSTAFPSVRLEKYISEKLEKGGLKVSHMDCSGSYCYGNSSIMELSMKYQIDIPILLFEIPIVKKEEKVRVKGWTGYEGAGIKLGKEDLVYITDTGIVYHSTPTCNYLDLSIRRVAISEAEMKYDFCSLCKASGKQTKRVYITTYGRMYHNSLNCSGLKRSIYAIKQSEIHGKGGCPKCVK